MRHSLYQNGLVVTISIDRSRGAGSHWRWDWYSLVSAISVGKLLQWCEALWQASQPLESVISWGGSNMDGNIISSQGIGVQILPLHDSGWNGYRFF